MTDLRALLQEARDFVWRHQRADSMGLELLDSLDNILAEPAPEPVGWWFRHSNGNIVDHKSYPSREACLKDWPNPAWGVPVPLYAAPPSASPDLRDTVVAHPVLALRQLLYIWDAGMPDETARLDMVEAFDAVRAAVELEGGANG